MSELKRHHINEVMDMHALTRGELGYSQVYYADDVDGVIAKLNARIHELENTPHTDNSAVIDALETENEALKKELAELRDAYRWRKVSEELPAKWERVLLYAPKYGVGFGYWANTIVKPQRVWNFSQDKQDGVLFKPVLEFHYVTHWKPLPSEPKEEE